MREISLSTMRKNEIIEVTTKVEAVVASSGIKEGTCLVFAPHSTASILILEADAAVDQDVLSSLSSLVPKKAEYRT